MATSLVDTQMASYMELCGLGSPSDESLRRHVGSGEEGCRCANLLARLDLFARGIRDRGKGPLRPSRAGERLLLLAMFMSYANDDTSIEKYLDDGRISSKPVLILPRVECF